MNTKINKLIKFCYENEVDECSFSETNTRWTSRELARLSKKIFPICTKPTILASDYQLPCTSEKNYLSGGTVSTYFHSLNYWISNKQYIDKCGK